MGGSWWPLWGPWAETLSALAQCVCHQLGCNVIRAQHWHPVRWRWRRADVGIHEEIKGHIVHLLDALNNDVIRLLHAFLRRGSGRVWHGRSRGSKRRNGRLGCILR